VGYSTLKANEKKKNLKEQILVFWLEVLEYIAIHIYATNFESWVFCACFEDRFSTYIFFSNFGLQYVHNISTYLINKNNLVLWVIGIRMLAFDIGKFTY
jgi:alpha-L-arabinofuranosidase